MMNKDQEIPHGKKFRTETYHIYDDCYAIGLLMGNEIKMAEEVSQFKVCGAPGIINHHQKSELYEVEWVGDFENENEVVVAETEIIKLMKHEGFECLWRGWL